MELLAYIGVFIVCCAIYVICDKASFNHWYDQRKREEEEQKKKEEQEKEEK